MHGGDRTWNRIPNFGWRAAAAGLKPLAAARPLRLSKNPTSFTGVPIHVKHVFMGVPKIRNTFSVEYTESPSLKGSIEKTDRSRDPDIWSLISSVSGICTWSVWCVYVLGMCDVCMYTYHIYFFLSTSLVYLPLYFLTKQKTTYCLTCLFY